MPREEQPTLAQVAYDAHSAMLRLYKACPGAPSRDGEPPPRPWEDLTPKEHAAWQYVVDTIERQVLALVAR